VVETLVRVHLYHSAADVQGGSKKVSCYHNTTAYFFWATLYSGEYTNFNQKWPSFVQNMTKNIGAFFRLHV